MTAEHLRHLHALADPSRIDLFEQLRVRNRPMSTGELARLVPHARRGIQSHLAVLAEGGWIEHLRGEGRAAVWQATQRTVRWSTTDKNDPSVAQAIEDAYWVAVQRRVNRIRNYDAERQTGRWSDSWLDAAIGRDYSLWLTAEDLADLDDELAGLMERFRARSNAHRKRFETDPPADTEMVFVVLTAFPLSQET
ncbi:ArsR/SmtB family transcription factor [Phycicoccus flavus]|uniref:Helix-turn-helix transcriptional regulator n=1 Tax=Phycicoccus flavus TaxID=2502783 RepID=A0A8T6R6R9_9MICO|nr:winged helix-turn-helix domain-containing protein [Phycicoccus flavus]NHA69442.1 helix-turn-helix transcriptional regulator [Phycicoccus flavus]